MRIKGTFLRGRVARRIFALFVVSTFVPALALAVLSLGQVRSVLTEQSRARLNDTSQAYAMTVYERLLLAQSALAYVASGLSEGIKPSDGALRTLEPMYSSMVVVGPQAQPDTIMGAETIEWPQTDKWTQAHLDKGEAVLIVESVARRTPRILLLQMVDAAKPERFAVAAALDPAYLWGAPENYPYMIDLCILADTGDVLFCSQPELAAGSAGLVSATADARQSQLVELLGEPRVAGHWQLFLKPKFFAPYWTAVALTPASVALAPIDKFSHILVGVVALAVLLVALLSVTQIRRTMGPLDKLIRGTRRLAEEDFDHRVPVASADEFGELAGSFNHMAARLGRQVADLKVLSGIDRVILSRLDMDPILGMVLDRARAVTRTRFAAVVVPDASACDEGRLYSLRAGHVEAQMHRLRIAAGALERLAASPQGVRLEGPDSLRQLFPQPEFLRSHCLFVLPVLAAGRVCALLCLELSAAEDFAPGVLGHLRGLGDRVGVALSALARDEQLVYQARHDDLTGLPNRLLFKERLSREIAFAQREQRSVALLFIDLDRFKSVNDSLGHSAGDRLLAEAARRLRRCVRESDDVARLGGDEFAVILPGISGGPNAASVAKHVLQMLSEPFEISGLSNYVNASIGIAVYPSDAQDGEELLRKADTAMYRAKDAGRGRFVYFEERMNTEAIERMTLERELRQALLRDEFILHYQPQIDLKTGRTTGAEALLRWNHPTRGLVAPGAFIGVAEDTGLIEEIGRRVILQACAQYAAWLAAGVPPPRIAVNVSARQFRRGDLLKVVADALAGAGLPGSALEVEVTESLLMDDSAGANAMLGELRRMGLRVALDDFGTGYSSMAYLKELPFDVLKIDRSFVMELGGDREAGAIAEAMVTLAHKLKKSVVAEGVETPEQLDILRAWQCDAVQGYIFSRPLPPDRLVEFLLQRGLTIAAEAIPR